MRTGWSLGWIWFWKRNDRVYQYYMFGIGRLQVIVYLYKVTTGKSADLIIEFDYFKKSNGR